MKSRFSGPVIRPIRPLAAGEGSARRGLGAQNVQDTGKLIGASFALTGFSVAVVAGLMSGNPAVTILTRALGALVVCRLLGGFLGYIGDRITVEAAATRSAACAVQVGASGVGSGQTPATSPGVEANMKIAA